MCKSKKTGKWSFFHCFHETDERKTEKTCEAKSPKKIIGWMYVCCRCGKKKFTEVKD